ARREISVVRHPGLRFEAATVAERDVGAELVVIFAVDAHIEDVDGDSWMDAGLGEQARSATGGANFGGSGAIGDSLLRDLPGSESRENVLTVEVCGRRIGVARVADAEAG